MIAPSRKNRRLRTSLILPRFGIAPPDIPGFFAMAVARPYSAIEPPAAVITRSEEHTSELQSLLRISYAVFCLTKKIKDKANKNTKYSNTNNKNTNTYHIQP